MNKEQTDRRQILSLPDITSADTGAGIYAWIFPDCYKDGLIPLYIGQSTNLWKRVRAHEEGLRAAYNGKADGLYWNIKHSFELVGIKELPDYQFKVVARFPVSTKKELLSAELFTILNFGTNFYGFNSPLPWEFYYNVIAPDSASEADIKFFDDYVTMLEQCYSVMGSDAPFLDWRKKVVKTWGIMRGQKCLSHKKSGEWVVDEERWGKLG